MISFDHTLYCANCTFAMSICINDFQCSICLEGLTPLWVPHKSSTDDFQFAYPDLPSGYPPSPGCDHGFVLFILFFELVRIWQYWVLVRVPESAVRGSVRASPVA